MKKKPIEVDAVLNTVVGVRVPIKLDRESNRFFATYAGERYEHETCGNVKAMVREAIEAAQKLDWMPVIQIERLMPFSAEKPEHFIGFTLERYYIAFTSGGRIVQTRWFVDPEGADMPLSVYRKKAISRVRGANDSNDMSFVESFTWDEEQQGKFRLPYPYEGCLPAGDESDWREEQTFYVAFTPELWRALELLQERIEEARRRLDELLLTPGGHKLLEAWGGQLSQGAAVLGLLATAAPPAAKAAEGTEDG
jgi:hypothetical protein